MRAHELHGPALQGRVSRGGGLGLDLAALPCSLCVPDSVDSVDTVDTVDTAALLTVDSGGWAAAMTSVTATKGAVRACLYQMKLCRTTNWRGPHSPLPNGVRCGALQP